MGTLEAAVKSKKVKSKSTRPGNVTVSHRRKLIPRESGERKVGELGAGSSEGACCEGTRSDVNAGKTEEIWNGGTFSGGIWEFGGG